MSERLGRPRKRQSDVRNSVLHVYVTKREKEFLFSAAAAADKDASSYFRKLLLEGTAKRQNSKAHRERVKASSNKHASTPPIPDPTQ